MFLGFMFQFFLGGLGFGFWAVSGFRVSGVEGPDLRFGTIFACPGALVVERPNTKKKNLLHHASRCGEQSCESEVSHRSSHSRAAVKWIGHVQGPSMSLTGNSLPDFDALDSKTASGLRKMIAGNFKRQVATEGRKAQTEGRLTTKRQIALRMCKNFKISSESGSHT